MGTENVIRFDGCRYFRYYDCSSSLMHQQAWRGIIDSQEGTVTLLMFASESHFVVRKTKHGKRWPLLIPSCHLAAVTLTLVHSLVIG